MITKQRSYTVPLNLQQLAKFTVSLPLFAFGFCIFWSFWYNFENSTYTHCEVDNFAPSISAAIGSFVPQKYVWQTCMAIHTAPRFLFAVLYNNIYHARLTYLTSRTKLIIRLNFCLAVTEILALLGLSIVSSQEQFDIHKVCFGTFLATAFCYMGTSYYLYTCCGFKPQNSHELTSLQLKKIILSINVLLIPLLMFFYHRHNEYCEPYIYSWFCICEYLIVILNMVFHFLAYKDFRDLVLVIPSVTHLSAGSSHYAPLKEEA